MADFTNNQDSEVKYELWENTSKEMFNAELSALNTSVSTLAQQIAGVVEHNDYEETAELRDRLIDGDLGSDGWLARFYNANSGTFPDGVRTMSRPSWVDSLPAEKQKTYETALSFHQDAKILLDAFAQVELIFRYLPLEDAFRIQRLKLNFEDVDMNESVYDKVNKDTLAISELINSSWSSLEEKARRSRVLYQDSHGILSKDAFEKEYRRERSRDYQDIVKGYSVYERLYDRGDGTFSNRSDWIADMKIIDKYTQQVAIIKNLDTALEKALNECKGFTERDVPAMTKNLKNEYSRHLSAALQNLVEKTTVFASTALEDYKKFRSGDSEAPYCFMKKLPSLSSVKSNYSFDPSRDEPTQYGTSYYEIYQFGRVSINTHSKEFVYEHGENI